MIDASFGLQKQQNQPHIVVLKDKLKIITFPKGMIGMRVFERYITPTEDIAFEMSDALRCFLKKILPFQETTLSIDDKKITISAEMATSAIQYTFNVKKVDVNDIDNHTLDISCKVFTHDWLHLWQTIPPRGTITMSISNQSKMLTLKHSTGRWGGAIFLKKKPPKSKSVMIDTVVAKSVLKTNSEDLYSNVVFMHCGVFQWHDSQCTSYIAPITNDKNE
jgi:hypothetical protein